MAEAAGTGAALARLEPLIGRWDTAVRFPDGATSEPLGSATFGWELGGKYVIGRSEAPDPFPDGVTLFSVNADGETYTQHYFDSRGVTRLYAMTFADGNWELLRKTPDFSPLPFKQRYTGRLSEDGAAIDGRWEKDTDGSGWELDFDLIYTRAG